MLLYLKASGKLKMKLKNVRWFVRIAIELEVIIEEKIYPCKPDIFEATYEKAQDK